MPDSSQSPVIHEHVRTRDEADLVIRNGSRTAALTHAEQALTGYNLREDAILEPDRDVKGQISNPDLILKPHNFCSKCKTFAPAMFSWTPYEGDQQRFASFPFHDSIASFKDEILQGCHLCSLLWGLMEEGTRGLVLSGGHETPDARLGSLSIAIQDYKNKAFADRPRLRVQLSNEDRTGKLLNFGAGTVREQILGDNLQQEADLSASNASKATFELASSWLHRCVSGHEVCRAHDAEVFRMPTRLLEVNNGKLRIIYPSERMKYLAVSHCWGTKHILRLEKGNYNSLTQGFQISDVPQLYRDCITVAQRLGVPHLWIDSLCIIQDSTEDWLAEAARMGEVYRGSYCTIAAVSAPDGDTSMFSKYHPLCMQHCHFASQDPEEDIRGINVGHPYQPNRMPLYTRAWVAQERILSPRMLEYTERGIRWRCGSDDDMGNNTDLKRTNFDNLAEAWTTLLKLRGGCLDDDERIDGHLEWMDLLDDYSRHALTFEKDRPHALKGIISTLQSTTGLTFVAGVCRDFFPYSLLWHRLDAGDVDDVAKWTASGHESPSWSCSFRHGFATKADWDGYHACAEAEFRDGPSDAQPRLWIKGRYLATVAVGSADPEKPRRKFILEEHPEIQVVLDYRIQTTQIVHLVLFVELSDSEDLEDRAWGIGMVLIPVEPGSDTWERMGIFNVAALHGEDCDSFEVQKRTMMGRFGDEREFLVQ